MAGNVADCILAAAQFLAAQPGAVQRALTTHRCRPDGRCTGCGVTLVRWPCAIASSALLAQRLVTETGRCAAVRRAPDRR